MSSKRIYLSPPHMGQLERDLLLDAFASNWIAPLGPQVDAFEKDMCEKLGCGYAVALSSGTAALHLALLNLNVQPRDEVLCSTLTFSASANAVVYCGARPVFVDADPTTWNLDPALVAEEVNRMINQGRPPKAVIAVDLYGRCADIDPIKHVCAIHGVGLIEDAAEALGASYNGRKAGTLGDMGVLSFNGNKIITTSGGGMLLSDRKEWIDRARFLSTQARDPAPHYQHSEIGYNYRMSNLLAAVGRGQLKVLEQRVERKRAINARYRNALSGVPGISFMPEASYDRSNCWLTCIMVDPQEFGATREDIRLHLEKENIEARPVWKPMHLQPVFKDCRFVGSGVADRLFTVGLCLPSGTAMDDASVDRIVGEIRKVHKR